MDNRNAQVVYLPTSISQDWDKKTDLSYVNMFDEVIEELNDENNVNLADYNVPKFVKGVINLKH